MQARLLLVSTVTPHPEERMAPAARSQLAVPSVAYTNGRFQGVEERADGARVGVWGGGYDLHGVVARERRFQRSQIMRLGLFQGLGES